jgi:GNAT superfamily N-acetyltransferase
MGKLTMPGGEIHIRIARLADVPGMQLVRNSVKENSLSNPALISDNDVETYIAQRGRGWVSEINDAIVGFAIADLVDNNIWALFVHPGFEKQGIGKRLHHSMLDWYFSLKNEKLWLSTSPGTRAEKFYRLLGWKEAGMYGKGEIKFEMDRASWLKNKPA